MVSCLRDIDAVKFEPLMNKLMTEFRDVVNGQICTSKNLVRTYLSFMRIY